ncbi:hypothetical protein DPMN_092513 [Dreissena polymorpha]|uniref:Uncharacterized protein n=1 Tax=Dreissena polymorpha TaxID=45954 RepID=A0A9D4L3T5_DREPO|nr:hypothetical protein DPMN_092513 [Dreissena polymorpha]
MMNKNIRPQLSEQNSRHNFPEPRPCCNVSNVHHLRDNKNDCDGHQLQHSGFQSQDQEVFDYMEPLSGIWSLSANDLRTIIDQTGNGNSSERSSNKSHEKDSIDGSSKLLARCP